MLKSVCHSLWNFLKGTLFRGFNILYNLICHLENLILKKAKVLKLICHPFKRIHYSQDMIFILSFSLSTFLLSLCDCTLPTDDTFKSTAVDDIKTLCFLNVSHILTDTNSMCVRHYGKKL